MKTTLTPPPRLRTEKPGMPEVPYQGLFREPVYLDGQPYDSDDDSDDGHE